MSPLSLQRVPVFVAIIASAFGFGCATLPPPDAATVAAAAMRRYSTSPYQGYAFGLAPCLTTVFIRSFIFGTSDSAH